MRYAPRRPVYQTRADVEAGLHYAQHILQGEPNGPRYPMTRTIDVHAHTKGVLGVPVAYDYRDGALVTWPEPAEGWRVFAAVSGKDVTP
jgi:hypothetical protein